MKYAAVIDYLQDKAVVDVSGIPSFAWMSADAVADEAVRAVGHGPVLVNGVMNSVMASVIRFVPRQLTNRLVASFLRPKPA